MSLEDTVEIGPSQKSSEGPGVTEFTETRNGWGSQALGQGNPCVTGAECPFGERREFWRWTMNVLSATELCAGNG